MKNILILALCATVCLSVDNNAFAHKPKKKPAEPVCRVKLGANEFEGPQTFVENEIAKTRGYDDKLRLERYQREDTERERRESLAFLTSCTTPMPHAAGRIAGRTGVCGTCAGTQRIGGTTGTSLACATPGCTHLIRPNWLNPRKFRFGGRTWEVKSGDPPTGSPMCLGGSLFTGPDGQPRFMDCDGRIWIDPPGAGI